MEIVKVGICLEDKTFAQAIAQGLARETSMMRFYLLNSIEEGTFCDMILSSETSRQENVVQMVRDWETATGDMTAVYDQPPYRVYRYRESTNLINDLLFIYYRLTGKTVEYRGTTTLQLLLFLADSGGSGTTSTALAVLKMLYRIYGVRSLYLNLCPLDDSGKYLKKGGEASLLKLLYYLAQERDFPVASFITREEELDYISVGSVNTDFSEMNPTLMFRLLHKVDKLGKYDFVAADIGNILSRENKKLLEYSDLAVLISDGERKLPGAYREKISREIMNLLGSGRLICVENFLQDDLEMPEKDKVLEEQHSETSSKKISRYSISKQCGGNLQLEKNYGYEISLIAREIMEEQLYETRKQV